MPVFDDYKVARKAAEIAAHDTCLDIAIRKVREYGKVRFAVSFACRNDSDYARAEIVRPEDGACGPSRWHHGLIET